MAVNTHILELAAQDPTNGVFATYGTMTGAIVDDEHIDIDSLARIVSEGFGNDEFDFVLDVFGKEGHIFLKAEDVHALKNYIERA